jgi:hypothetical protein
VYVHATHAWRIALSCALVLTACGDEDGGGSEGDAAGFALLESPAVILHATQPMVVDIELELSQPAVVELRHDSDPGVHIAPLLGDTPAIDDAPARQHTLRVRGLRPGMTHAMTLQATSEDGETIPARALTFTTLAPLEGFAPSYPVSLDATRGQPSALYRAFSMVGVYSVGYHAAVVLDPAGATRWYLTAPSPQTSATSPTVR